jgi:hypothetical protein
MLDVTARSTSSQWVFTRYSLAQLRSHESEVVTAARGADDTDRVA